MTYLFIAYNMHHYTVLEVPYMHQHTFFIKLPCGLNCAVYALLSERNCSRVLYVISRFQVHRICGIIRFQTKSAVFGRYEIIHHQIAFVVFNISFYNISLGSYDRLDIRVLLWE